jgi:hypothetical protein
MKPDMNKPLGPDERKPAKQADGRVGRTGGFFPGLAKQKEFQKETYIQLHRFTNFGNRILQGMNPLINPLFGVGADVRRKSANGAVRREQASVHSWRNGPKSDGILRFYELAAANLTVFCSTPLKRLSRRAQKSCSEIPQHLTRRLEGLSSPKRTGWASRQQPKASPRKSKRFHGVKSETAEQETSPSEGQKLLSISRSPPEFGFW